MCRLGERDLRGAGEVEVVGGEPVDVRALVGGEAPVPIIASSRTSTGGSTGVNPFCGEAVERERGRARVRGARCRRSSSRSASRRCRAARSMSKRPTSVCSRGSSSAGGSPTRRSSTTSSSSCRPATTRAAGSGSSRARSVACGLGGGELLLGGRRSSFTCCISCELLRRGLALQLRLAPQLVDPSAPAPASARRPRAPRRRPRRRPSAPARPGRCRGRCGPP